MSQTERANELKIEIQKLLTEINKDMSKLKTEVASLNHIIEEDASLPTNVRMVNERLMIAAKEAGIDLEDLETVPSGRSSEQNASEHGASEQDETEKDNGTQDSQESQRTNEETASTSNAAELAAATEKLTKAVKRTLR